MGAARYEILSTLPPGSGGRTRLASSGADGAFRRMVVLREVPAGHEVTPVASAPMGVLPLLDVVELEGKTWAVYEFVAGATLAEVAAAHFAVDRLPSLGLIARVIVDAARAVQRLHANDDPLGLNQATKHGGISDQSIFVGFDGVTRVLDLGARRLSRFIAPELTRGVEFDLRADIFSLGAVLHGATTRFEKGYAATMARAPTAAEFPPPSAIHPEAVPALDSLVMKSLMTSPGARLPSAEALADGLEQTLGEGLFTPSQVATVLQPLFSERIAALKELVDPKRRPPAPRASAPPRKSRAAIPSLSGNVDLSPAETPGALGDDDSATDAHAVPEGVRPGPPVPDFDPDATGVRSIDKISGRPPPVDYDPDETNAGKKPRPSRPPPTDPERPALAPRASPNRPVTRSFQITQSEEEKALAKGQEKISTAELEQEEMSDELRSLQGPALGEGEEVSTAVRPRPSQPKRAPPPRIDEERDTDEPARIAAIKPRRGRKVLLALFFLLMAGISAGLVTQRPEMIVQAMLKAGLDPPASLLPAPTEQLDAGEVVADADGGAGEAVPVAVAVEPDAGLAESDAGAAEPADAGPTEAIAVPADAGVAQVDAGVAPAKAEPDAGKVSDPPKKEKDEKKKKKRR